jgi:hypothetical protein
MATAFLVAPPPAIARRPLSEDDAVDIWIARWLRIRPADLVRRYSCDPRRLYEIWEEARAFPAAVRGPSMNSVAVSRASSCVSIPARIGASQRHRIPAN